MSHLIVESMKLLLLLSCVIMLGINIEFIINYTLFVDFGTHVEEFFIIYSK